MNERKTGPGYNPEFDKDELEASKVKEIFESILSVPNDPYYFTNRIQKYFSIKTIRENLMRVGGIKELEAMLLDPHIQAATEKRKAAMRGARVKFDGESEEEIAFVEENLSKHVRKHILKNSWETWFYGYSVDELIWVEEDGLFKIDELRKMPFHWFKPDKDLKTVFYSKTLAAENNLAGDLPATYGKYLLSTKDATYSEPFGRGAAFSLYFVSKFKEMGWGFWGDWLQKYASGFIKASVSDAQAADPATLKKIKTELAKAIKGSAIVYKEGNTVDIEWPQSTGEQFKEFRNSAIDDINLVILGETLTSKVEGGSRAAAEVHETVQKEKIELDMALVEDNLNRLIDYIYTINERDKSQMPEAHVHFEKTLQLAKTERDKNVVEMTGKTFSEDYMIREYGYQEGDFAEKVEEDNDFTPSLSLKDTEVNLGLEEDVSKQALRSEKTASDIVTYLLNNEETFFDAADIFATIEASETPAQLQKNLEVYFEKDSEELEEVLTQAMFFAFAKGAESDVD